MSGIRVKPLEWVEHGDQDFVWHRAMSPIGYRYNIEDDGFSEKKHHLTVGQLVLGNFETLDEAKAAAQGDYDDRVLSCVAINAECTRNSEGARRYRWLKMESSPGDQTRVMQSTPWPQWDAAIDAMMEVHSQALPISKPKATKDATA